MASLGTRIRPNSLCGSVLSTGTSNSYSDDVASRCKGCERAPSTPSLGFMPADSSGLNANHPPDGLASVVAISHVRRANFGSSPMMPADCDCRSARDKRVHAANGCIDEFDRVE
jgi:hypothetical protein